MVDPLLTSTPCVYQPPDPNEQEIPDLYPSCAVIRTMANKVKQNNGMQDVNLADTLIGQSFNDELSNSLSLSLSPANLTFRLTLKLQDQTLTFHLQFRMTSCQGHSFVSNNTVILRYYLYLIEL